MTGQTEAIWKKFSERLRQFLLRRVNNEAVADDLLQDVFLKIHARIETLQDTTKVKRWIYQIARYTVIDYYRTHKLFGELPAELADTPQMDEEDYRQTTAQLGLRDMIEELPEPYKQALILTEYHGYTQKKMAEELGLSISGAKSRVQRARKMLKDNLLRCCHFEFDRYGTVVEYHPIACCCCSLITPLKKLS